MSYAMFYLSIKSKSVWPAILLHSMLNFVIQLLLDQSIGGEMRPYLVGETGIITIALIVAIAIICAWKYRRTGGENVVEVSDARGL